MPRRLGAAVRTPVKQKIVPFSKTSIPAARPTEPPDQSVLEIFSRGNAAGRSGVDHLTSVYRRVALNLYARYTSFWRGQAAANKSQWPLVTDIYFISKFLNFLGGKNHLFSFKIVTFPRLGPWAAATPPPQLRPCRQRQLYLNLLPATNKRRKPGTSDRVDWQGPLRSARD